MMFVEGRLTRPDWPEADVAGSRRQGRRRQVLAQRENVPFVQS